MNKKQTAPKAVVVNDDRIQLNILAGLLGKAGIEALAFEQAEAALAAMNPAEPPNLVVTDLYMPGIDGWRFCRLLRSPEYAAFNQVPILAISATFAGDHSERIAADIGADAFLPAPVDGREFAAQVQALLTGKTVRRQLRVLIVEDGKTLADLLRKTFAANGYRADTASTVREAQAAFNKKPYDVAVLDYHLPDGNGGDLLEALQAQRPDCVCLMMTTDPTPELALAWMKRGAAAYLRKPFEPELLIELSARARRERALLRAEDLLEKRTRELQKSEEQFRLIAENTSDVISLMDMSFQFTYVSPSITQLTGFTVEEALNYSIEDIIPLHSVKQIRKIIEKELKEEASGSVDLSRNRIIEYQQYKKDKSAIWVESNCRFLRDAEQKPNGIIIISRNVTKRKQAEDALKASEANFRAFFDSLHDMIVVGTPEGRVLYANDAIIDKLGYNLKELNAIGILGVHPPDRRGEAEEIFAAMFRGEQKTCPLPLQRKDGELVPVETRVFFGKWDGQECVFGICKDISAEQEALLKFERLFQKNPALMALSSLTDRRFVDVNDAFLETLGFERTEVLGRSAGELNLFPDADQQKILSDQLARKGSITAYELQVRAKDGSFRNGIFSGEVVSSQDRKYFLTVMIDITERKKAEIALQENEERLSRILLCANDGWWDWDLESDAMYYSDRWWEMLGYAKNEFASDSDLWRRLTHPDDAQRVQQFLDGVLTSDLDRYEVEFRMCHKQGHSLPVLSKGYLFRDSEGSLKRISGINIDLSERKKVEEQLRLHSLVLSQIEDRVTITDLNGNITFVNDAEVRALGFSRDELIGGSTEQYGENSEKGASQREILAETLKNGKWRGEVINQTKDGRDVVLDCRTQMVLDEHGHKVALAGIATDITERRLMEEALRESNKRLESFLQISRSITASIKQDELMQLIVDNAVRVMEIDSGAVYLLLDQDRICLAATTPPLPVDFPETFRIDCLSEHPHINKTVKSGIHVIMPDTKIAELSPAEQQIVQMLNLRSNLYLPIRLRGSSIGVLILSSIERKFCFTEEGVLLLQDFANQAAQILDNTSNFEQAKEYAAELEQEIAERKKAEEEREKLQAQLIQAQKMESVGRLAGGIAHDFNNMLGVILGRAELALESLEENEQLHFDLSEIQKAARHSADLTRQLLAFARRQTIAPKVLDLNATVAGMLKMLERLIGEDVDLAWKPGKDIWPVKIDPAQVDQILANLCVNARDAISGTGKITIETAKAGFDEDYCARHAGFAPGEFVLLAVSDNGGGMDKQTLNRIFEPFFTTKEVGQGTGLGLATVYGAVKQNNGFINVYSEPGIGTTIRIYLPRHAIQQTAKLKERESQAELRGSETILLVEDEPAILSMTSMMLERLGYTVLAARTPGEALRLAEKNSGVIDLLMTDVVMPEMNGRELAEKLLSSCPDLKRLFMSGYTANVIAHHHVLDEGVNFIQKPFSLNELGLKIREALGTDG